ncbi:MAG: histidine ammonia-lyase [Alphaproteobacteria bacterium]
MTKPFILRPGKLSLDDLRALGRSERTVRLDPKADAGIESAAALVARIALGDVRVYGVNTGFGSLARQAIPPADARELQRRLVLSHAAGTGPLLSDAVVRRVLLLKAASLALGRSGVRPQVIDALIALHNAEVYPCVPAKGSVGASGDLAPLAHIACALIGVGKVRHRGRVIAARAGLKRAGFAPLVLEAKEGLALLNGTQVSTALALEGLFLAERLIAAALVAGALSVDAALGSDAPFDARLNAARNQPGQIAVARILRGLLMGSAIRLSHLDCDRIQDPYSLRCQPQVMGAVLDMVRFAARVLASEANGVSDNPIVLAETGQVLSGGNFHAEPVAMAADVIAIALAEIGALAERRVALLIDAHFSSLPPFLVAKGGLNSGFMIAQVTAAALASENKSLAHPASVDSLPTSANQEDHVSMATFAARRLGEMADNVAGIVAIELLAAAQGIEFRRPLKSSRPLEAAHALIREHVAPWRKDRLFAPDLEAVKRLVLDGAFDRLVPEPLLPGR